jgi:pyruvate formate lyase activating enzyme
MDYGSCSNDKYVQKTFKLMPKGTIFNIEEFAVHDGPGIRKLVFFKGCPLRCTWCHNPEGISFKRELMVSYGACTQCGKCKIVCDNESCIACGQCITACPQRLRRIVGDVYDVETLAAKLLKGKDVLINSGGGITFSGGEPLAQAEFLLNLIPKLKPLHIAIETSGFANEMVFLKVISQVDLVMMDIKHTDTAIHKKFTGVDNHTILRNLNLLCASGRPFLIRIPLIPGVNDSRENMEETAKLLVNAKNLLGVELLPYHKTAPAKYGMLNKTYNPGFDVDQEVMIHTDVFEKYNIKINRL